MRNIIFPASIVGFMVVFDSMHAYHIHMPHAFIYQILESLAVYYASVDMKKNAASKLGRGVEVSNLYAK